MTTTNTIIDLQPTKVVPTNCMKFNSSFLYYIGFFIVLLVGYLWGRKTGVSAKGKQIKNAVKKSSKKVSKKSGKKSGKKSSKKSSKKSGKK